MTQVSDAYTTEDLLELGPQPTHDGYYATQVAFPLGGIGTGCVSLTARGSLVDWEIFNRPNKGTILPYSFFTIWARAQGQEPVTRVVQGPPSPPFTGQGGGGYKGLGFGVIREDGSGLPHMWSSEFRGEFPLAWVEFEEPALPVQVSLEAYSPFIPMNADESGLPIAVLYYTVANVSGKPVDVSLVGSLFNAVGYRGSGPFVGEHLGGNVNEYFDDGIVRGLRMNSDKYPADSPRYGTMALSTPWADVFCQTASLRAGWFDAMHDFWDHFSADGTLPEREYPPSADGSSDVGSLGLQAHLEPGESTILPFFISWHFPNFVKYWGDGGDSACCGEDARPTWRNYYASQWTDATDVAHYYADHEDRLYGQTKLFHGSLFASKLPPYVLDAISSQASILHSPTVLRLPDGTFYGFEGCHSDSGCCEGSCTHVWNYAQTVAFLFPALERSFREADYTYNLDDSGHMGFRLQLPLGSPPSHFHAAADGQLGGLLKLCRDWRLCGDDDWLRKWWPKARQALEYAWKQWDGDRDGIIDGIQHNTYDIEFSGPNSMIGSFYLGALRAAEEIARHLGEGEAADGYEELYQRGRAWVDAELFNGEWYVQKPNWELTPKYQYGEGCLADQVIGQWLATLVGLGPILDPEHVRTTLKSIFGHNWRAELWEHANAQRIYALNDEKGLLACTWPRGGRPAIPFPYSDEVWCGIEYQVASHLIYEGFVEEGLAIVRGTRERHEGTRRNPWNEFECGSHYARSLASWGVLTALSGFEFDLPRRTLGFTPRLRPDDWLSFWSVDGAWGTYVQEIVDGRGTASLRLDYGSLKLGCLILGSVKGAAGVEVKVDGKPVSAKAELVAGRLVVCLKEGVALQKGQALAVRLG